MSHQHNTTNHPNAAAPRRRQVAQEPRDVAGFRGVAAAQLSRFEPAGLGGAADDRNWFNELVSSYYQLL